MKTYIASQNVKSWTSMDWDIISPEGDVIAYAADQNTANAIADALSARRKASGIIPHKKFPGTSACIKPEHFAAEQCNRQAVTAEWLWEHPDVTGYIFCSEASDLGLDPWITIEGVDRERHGPLIILETGMNSERLVGPSSEVYVPSNLVAH